MTTFLRICPNHRDALEWARKTWDAYGFDYDTERSTSECVIAWPHKIDLSDLINNLAEDDIQYEEFEVDEEEWFSAKHTRRENKMVTSLKSLIIEDLQRYGNYDEGDPVGAAKDLSKLLDDLIPLIEKGLVKAGPFMAETVLEDMKTDLNNRLKNIKIPQQNSQLSAIMSDLDKEKAELDKRDAEKSAAKKEPAAPAEEKPAATNKKPIKVP